MSRITDKQLKIVVILLLTFIISMVAVGWVTHNKQTAKTERLYSE